MADIQTNPSHVGEYVDPQSGVPVSIDYVHHEIHAGNAFSCSTYATNQGAGAKTRISFLTGAKYVHAFWEASSSGLAYLRICENPTITDDTGSSLPVYNNNRNSATTSTVIDRSQNPDLVGSATLNPTVTDNGTVLRTAVMGSSILAGGQARNESELVLKPNEEYLFEVESGTAGNNLGLIVKWYENE